MTTWSAERILVSTETVASSTPNLRHREIDLGITPTSMSYVGSVNAKEAESIRVADEQRSWRGGFELWARKNNL